MCGKTFTAALLLLIISLATVAQQADRPTQDETIVTTTNLVTVNVMVADRDGKYVRGLTREQFEVHDNHQRQQIAHFAAAANPFSLAIVCEIHYSTPEHTRAILNSLRQFTRGLRNEDDFFFTAFSKEGSVTTSFIPTTAQLVDHLAVVKPGGPASLYDAVYSATERLKSMRHLKKAMLVVSDGMDDQSRVSYERLRDRLREFDLQIYSIGIANPAAENGRWAFEDVSRQLGRRRFLNSENSIGRAVLAEMARVSGGTAYVPETENEPELLGICTQIGLELREQYTIGFYPKELSTNRDRHRIQVRVTKKQDSRSLILSYRQSYRRAH